SRVHDQEGPEVDHEEPGTRHAEKTPELQPRMPEKECRDTRARPGRSVGSFTHHVNRRGGGCCRSRQPPPPPTSRSGDLRPLLRPNPIVHVRAPSVVSARCLRGPPQVERVEEVDVPTERVLDRVHELGPPLPEAL